MVFKITKKGEPQTGRKVKGWGRKSSKQKTQGGRLISFWLVGHMYILPYQNKTKFIYVTSYHLIPIVAIFSRALHMIMLLNQSSSCEFVDLAMNVILKSYFG